MEREVLLDAVVETKLIYCETMDCLNVAENGRVRTYEPLVRMNVCGDDDDCL